jgi:tripartite-type tricarboxylate transporter receptor subunit TctC
MHRLFRLSAVGTLLVGALLANFAARAQDTAGYPARPVKIIVPFAPAGPTDVMARLVAQKLGESLGKQFYVENHPGAGGNLGMALVANAAPDGYTLLMVSSSVVVNPSLYEKVPYDIYKSLAPITLAGSSPNILVVHPSVPAKTVKELIAYIQANPGKVSFASPGFGHDRELRGGELQIRTQARHPASAFQRRRTCAQRCRRRASPDRLHGAPAGHRASAGRNTARARDDN